MRRATSSSTRARSGLRLVKSTVNQDDPTVYHLFYADEEGSPGADLTFFEYPGARTGARRRRDGPPDGLARRLARGDRLLGSSGWTSEGVAPSATATALRFADPEGLAHVLEVSTPGPTRR